MVHQCPPQLTELALPESLVCEKAEGIKSDVIKSAVSVFMDWTLLEPMELIQCVKYLLQRHKVLLLWAFVRN
jgi:hypothetical protein